MNNLCRTSCPSSSSLVTAEPQYLDDAAETIGFPCFVILIGELSSTFYTAKALADDFVTSITAALAMGLGNGLLTPFITLWKVSSSIFVRYMGLWLMVTVQPRESIPRQGSYQRLQSSLLQHDHDLSKFCDNISGQGDRIIADVFGGLTKARAPTLVAFIAQHKPVGGAQAAIGLKPQHEEHAGVVAKLERGRPWKSSLSLLIDEAMC